MSGCCCVPGLQRVRGGGPLMGLSLGSLCLGVQGEDEAGVLHVQPHVWGGGAEEPDEARRGFLCLGGLLVHQADTVPRKRRLTRTVVPEFGRDGPFLTHPLALSGPAAACQRSGTWRIPGMLVKSLCALTCPGTRGLTSPPFSPMTFTKSSKSPKLPKKSDNVLG